MDTPNESTGDDAQLAALDAHIEASDLAALSRAVDSLTAGERWEDLLDLAERCDEAVERGKQVWAIRHLVEYRLALEAPAAYAGSVVGDASSGFSLGPLWEVAASTHSWASLEPHLGAPASRALAAHERVLRGDSVDPGSIDQRIVDLPLEVQPWEPEYPLAVYSSDHADFPLEIDAELEWVDLEEPGIVVDDPEATDALMDLVKPWWDESSGRAVAIAVEGDALAAIRSLGPRRARVGRVSAQVAMRAMAWAGASGGAYGKRRGGPAGRLGVWWVLAVLLGYDEPPDDPDWGDEASDLEWWLWDPGDQTGGWSLHFVCHNFSDGLAFALSAVDMR